MKLSTISESARKLVFAHVGASKNPDNPEHTIWHENDRHHMDLVWDWLDNNGYNLDLFLNRRDDFIDLNDGRDFLAEDHKYDVVVLHHVYSPHQLKHASQYRSPMGTSPFKVSRQHKPDNWKSRLMMTEASFIFAFGDYDEVSGKYLGEIRGYEGPMFDGFQLSAYVKDYDATEFRADETDNGRQPNEEVRREPI